MKIMGHYRELSVVQGNITHCFYASKNRPNVLNISLKRKRIGTLCRQMIIDQMRVMIKREKITNNMMLCRQIRIKQMQVMKRRKK
jgi:hypothetical protein